jgi:hypothetical protein
MIALIWVVTTIAVVGFGVAILCVFISASKPQERTKYFNNLN